MQKDTTRIWFFDNMKAVLIFFVVWGHILELGDESFLYSLIYVFHMPLFVFCSGYLAKYNPEKILKNIIYPYIVFQMLYVVFERAYLGWDTAIGFTRPVWIMWYMFAFIVWSLLLPLIEVSIKSKKGIIITIGTTLMLGIVAGFDENIGYFLSLSRILYFLPFFVIGVCIKRAMSAEAFLSAMSKRSVKYISGMLSLGILIGLYFFVDKIEARWLYGVSSYAKNSEGGYFVTTRMAIYLCTAIISLFIISIMPRRKMFFSYIGQRCIQVYLLHAFVVRILGKSKVLKVFADRPLMFYVVSFLISAIIVYILSLKIWGKLLKPLFSFPAKEVKQEKIKAGTN